MPKQFAVTPPHWCVGQEYYSCENDVVESAVHLNVVLARKHALDLLFKRVYAKRHVDPSCVTLVC